MDNRQKMIHDTCSYIMEQIPDAAMRKYSLRISDDILLEDGMVCSFGCYPHCRPNDLWGIKDGIRYSLIYNQVPVCKIVWKFDIAISMGVDDILNIFKDDTIIDIYLILSGGEYARYSTYKSERMMGAQCEIFERFGRSIYVYASNKTDINIIQVHVTRTIQSILNGG